MASRCGCSSRAMNRAGSAARQLVAGHGITASHYQIVADISSGLRLGDQVPLGPYRDPYTVVGLTQGMVTSAGDPIAWITLLDAQAIQFAVAPPLQRREEAAGRSPLVTADINAVLVSFIQASRKPLSHSRSIAGSICPPSASSRKKIT